AAGEIRQKLAVRSTLVDLDRITAETEELKLLHRIGAWEALPRRYTSLRKQLVALRSLSPVIRKTHKASLQRIIDQFNSAEEIVEQALRSKEAPPDPVHLNKIVAEQVDRLNGILVLVQQNIGA